MLIPRTESSETHLTLSPVVRSESVRNIIRERRMLEHLNHPFLCNLRYSFQDIEYMYVLIDLYQVRAQSLISSSATLWSIS